MNSPDESSAAADFPDDWTGIRPNRGKRPPTGLALKCVSSEGRTLESLLLRALDSFAPEWNQGEDNLRSVEAFLNVLWGRAAHLFFNVDLEGICGFDSIDRNRLIDFLNYNVDEVVSLEKALTAALSSLEDYPAFSEVEGAFLQTPHFAREVDRQRDGVRSRLEALDGYEDCEEWPEITEPDPRVGVFRRLDGTAQAPRSFLALLDADDDDAGDEGDAEPFSRGVALAGEFDTLANYRKLVGDRTNGSGVYFFAHVSRLDDPDKPCDMTTLHPVFGDQRPVRWVYQHDAGGRNSSLSGPGAVLVRRVVSLGHDVDDADE